VGGNVSKEIMDVTLFMSGLNRILAYVLYRIPKINVIPLLDLALNYINTIKDSNAFSFSAFKNDIASLNALDDSTRESISDLLSITENLCITTNNMSEIRKYAPVLYDSINEVCVLIDKASFDRAYDLVDAIHCLPEALLDKNKWDPKSYWKTYIGAYRRKWDKSFLIQREKEVLNKNPFRSLVRLLERWFVSLL
jgi:hypothetical protein